MILYKNERESHLLAAFLTSRWLGDALRSARHGHACLLAVTADGHGQWAWVTQACDRTMTVGTRNISLRQENDGETMFERL